MPTPHSAKEIHSSQVSHLDYQCCSSHPPIRRSLFPQRFAFISHVFLSLHLDACCGDIPPVTSYYSPPSWSHHNEQPSASPSPTPFPGRDQANSHAGPFREFEPVLNRTTRHLNPTILAWPPILILLSIPP